MILEKVYDELYGMIEDLKKKIQAADVDITPALDSGTKIADYVCDGDSGSLYAPTQVNADWNASEGAAEILNKPTIPKELKLDTQEITTAANGQGTTAFPANRQVVAVYSNTVGACLILTTIAGGGQTIRAIDNISNQPAWVASTYNVTYAYYDIVTQNTRIKSKKED